MARLRFFTHKRYTSTLRHGRTPGIAGGAVIPKVFDTSRGKKQSKFPCRHTSLARKSDVNTKWQRATSRIGRGKVRGALSEDVTRKPPHFPSVYCDHPIANAPPIFLETCQWNQAPDWRGHERAPCCIRSHCDAAAGEWCAHHLQLSCQPLRPPKSPSSHAQLRQQEVFTVLEGIKRWWRLTPVLHPWCDSWCSRLPLMWLVVFSSLPAPCFHPHVDRL